MLTRLMRGAGKNHQNRRRSNRAQSFIELGASMIVILPVILLMIDGAIIAIACSLNDSVCRDSARAAASGPPGGSAPEADQLLAPGSSPYTRALAVVDRVYNTNIPAKIRENISVKESLVDIPPAPQGGAVSGQITVETTIDINPPFLVRAIVPTGLALACRHTVPYTYVVPNTSI